MATETKPILPNIFHLVGLIACGFMTFMGLAYAFNGNLVTAGLTTVFALVILAIFVHYLSYWKEKKRKNTDPPNRLPEIILGAFYLIIFFIIYIINTHYLFIDFSKKDAIREAGVMKVNNLINLQKSYTGAISERVNSFDTKARTAKDRFLSSRSDENKRSIDDMLGVRSIDFNAKEEQFLKTFEAALDNSKQAIRKRYQFPIDSFNRAADIYTPQAKDIFENWRWLKLSHTYSDIDKFTARFEQAARNTMSDFSYATQSIPAYSFSNPAASVRSASAFNHIVYLILLLIIHACILAPYLNTKRQLLALKENTNRQNNISVAGDLTEKMNQIRNS